MDIMGFFDKYYSPMITAHYYTEDTLFEKESLDSENQDLFLGYLSGISYMENIARSSLQKDWFVAIEFPKPEKLL